MSEWRESTWGEEISLEYGKALRGYNPDHGKYRVFGSNGPIGWHSEYLTTGPAVILGRKGAYRGVEYWRDPFWVIDTAYYVVPKTELDPRWLYYAIKHYKLGEIDDGSPIPSTTRAAVYVKELQVPPLREQQAIACILGALDDKIELNRRRNRTLEAMARAIFQSWFVDFDPVHHNARQRPQRATRGLASAAQHDPSSRQHPTSRHGQSVQHNPTSRRRQSSGASVDSMHRQDPSTGVDGSKAFAHDDILTEFRLKPELAALFPDRFEDSPLGPIPAGWRVGTVGDIAEFNGWTLGKRDELDVIDYIEISEVMRGEVGKVTRYIRGEEPGRARRRLRHGDTAISTVRPDRGSYFLSIEPSPNLIASTGFAVLTAKCGHWAFVHVLTTGEEFSKELGRLADGGAYPAVRPEVIAAQQIVRPDPNELLDAFEKVAQPLFLRAEAARKESRALAALRDALLPKLISGELRVPDAERIVGRAT